MELYNHNIVTRKEGKRIARMLKNMGKYKKVSVVDAPVSAVDRALLSGGSHVRWSRIMVEE